MVLLASFSAEHRAILKKSDELINTDARSNRGLRKDLD